MNYNDPEKIKIWKSYLDLQVENYKEMVTYKEALEVYKIRGRTLFF